MKVCITSTGKEIDANIDATFGRAPYFLIIDTDTTTVEVVENRASTRGQGTGIAAAQIVAEKGATAVLTGFVRSNAFNALRAGDIRVFEGVSSDDTVKEALEKFKRGEYKEGTAPYSGPGCGPGKGRGRGRGRGRLV